MSYTNPTSSNWNPELYSKQIGGDKCTMVCKKKCKKNCATYCQLAKSDEDVKETVRTLKEKRDKLKEKLKESNLLFLSSTDWKILRHIREKQLGISTTLSEKQYTELETLRQEAAKGI